MVDISVAPGIISQLTTSRDIMIYLYSFHEVQKLDASMVYGTTKVHGINIYIYIYLIYNCLIDSNNYWTYG